MYTTDVILTQSLTFMFWLCSQHAHDTELDPAEKEWYCHNWFLKYDRWNLTTPQVLHSIHFGYHTRLGCTCSWSANHSHRSQWGPRTSSHRILPPGQVWRRTHDNHASHVSCSPIFSSIVWPCLIVFWHSVHLYTSWWLSMQMLKISIS